MILLLQAFHRESVLWYGLLHKNIVPFLGVSQDVIGESLCMVLPWYEHGSLREHLDDAYVERRYHNAEENFKMVLTRAKSSLSLAQLCFSLSFASVNSKRSVSLHCLVTRLHDNFSLKY